MNNKNDSPCLKCKIGINDGCKSCLTFSHYQTKIIKEERGSRW